MQINRTHFLVPIAALSAAALFCIAAESPAIPKGKTPPAQNPHWKKESCAACHDMSTGVAAPIAARAIDSLCFSCHDGRKAHAEPHPTGRQFPTTRAMRRPESWPLSQGELGCITCHDAQFGCDLKRHVRADNRNLLRQEGGGPAHGKSFCENCHAEQEFPKLNPHLMLGGDGHAIVERCTFCHSEAPDARTLKRTFEAKFKAPQSAICLDCHPRHRDPLVQTHIGLRLTPDEQAYMCAVESTGLSIKPSPQTIARLKAAKTRPALLIPASDGTILCSTCHNPHQAGVFAPESQLAFGAMSLDARNKIVSPVREPQWCRRCHAN